MHPTVTRPFTQTATKAASKKLVETYKQTLSKSTGAVTKLEDATTRTVSLADHNGINSFTRPKTDFAMTYITESWKGTRVTTRDPNGRTSVFSPAAKESSNKVSQKNEN